jgi:hypothetical protein
MVSLMHDWSIGSWIYPYKYHMVVDAVNNEILYFHSPVCVETGEVPKHSYVLAVFAWDCMRLANGLIYA